MKKVIIISPHLDDETLGVGGTIFYHKSVGDSVYWINVTLPLNPQKKKRRKLEQRRISDFFGFKESYQMNFISTELEGNNKQLISEFSELFNEIQPNVVYLPNRTDVHSDHRNVFHAAYSCTKNFRYPFIERILLYETLSETEFAPAFSADVFLPNVFIDISKFINLKIEAMNIYEMELMNEKQPRSIKAITSLGHFRGTHIGCDYAESFMLIFEKC